MDNHLNSLNSNNSEKKLSKSQVFVENTKKAVRKALTTVGIAASSMGPVATPTVVPASVNTITAVTPLASTAVKTIGLGTAAGLFAACGGGEDGPDGPIDTKDTIAPTININQNEVDITGGKQVRINGNQLYIGDILVASRSDNKTKNCNVTLSINGKSITSGTTISEEGTLTIKVSDEAGNTKNADVKLNAVKNAPSITVNQYEINIFGGIKVNINNNQLLLGDEVIASRNDDDLESCKVSLSLNGQEIKPGDTINESGKLTITVTNKNGVTSTAEITLTNDAIFGIENLRNATIQVDKEINLLSGITFADGIELVKTEVEIDGQRSSITDPNHYTPEYPGTCNIIFTIKGKSGNTVEVKVDNLTIKPLEYQAMEITNIKPVDILPIIGQIEAGDKQVYEHIEHLRVAEATRIRDMMWKYGAGNHSAEEYQQLMNRLNTGMTLEFPSGYDNYNIMGGEIIGASSSHASCERSILNTLINHANLRINNPLNDRTSTLTEFIKNNPNSINIFGNSKYTSANNKSDYNKLIYSENVENLCNSKNFIIFAAGTNINSKDGHLRNRIFNGEYEANEYGWYSLASMSNSDKNTQPNTHLLVTIATNKDGNIDQTDVDRESSKYPVGFANNVLFSGRGFPELTEGVIYGPSGRYTTSDTNYFNVAIADLCFQMFAEVEDVDKLLEMIRATSLTDYIRLDGQTQELQLMNPAGFFEKYLMPIDLPNTLKSDKTVPLNKGYYKGVIFDIPGAEVKINGERITYNDTNKSKIKNQNPMNLEWRLNGDLCKKMGYKGKDIQGKIIIVDDKRNGLNMDKDFSINIQ